MKAHFQCPVVALNLTGTFQLHPKYAQVYNERRRQINKRVAKDWLILLSQMIRIYEARLLLSFALKELKKVKRYDVR